MAHTKVTKTYSQNTGVANTFSYSGSFDVFKGTEVVVELDNVELTYTASTINESASPREYTVDSVAKTVHIGGADLSSGTIIIRPNTDLGQIDNVAPKAKAEFTPGASITSADLNNNQTQLLRKCLEYDETILKTTGGVMTGDLGIGEDQTIYFEGATDDAYETTLTVVDPTADRTITLPNVTGTVVTTGDTGTVSGTMIANDAVDSQHYAADSIDAEHYAPGSVDGTAIANDAVDSQHYAADSIDAEHYAPGSVDGTAIANDAIDSQHYAAGSIDNEHIADDAINSEHYAAGSIDSEHIANDQIDSQHYAADSIDSEHYAPNSVDSTAIADDAVGADQLGSNAVVNDSVAAGAAIAHSKLANVTDGQILVGNGSNVPTAVAVSGDVTIANTGAVTIANDAVEIAMIGCEQTTISDSDSHIPTSGAVVDYVTSRIAPIGGLEVIADDESFPNTIPPAGVVISITDAAGLQVNSSGVSTNGDALDNSTITINGFPSELRGGVGSNPDPYVFQSGAGLMVQSTGSSQTYNYHQALIRESDFVQLSDDINDFNSRYRVAAGASGVRTGQCGSNGTGSGSYPCDGDMCWFTGASKMYVFDAPAASTSNSDLDAAWKEVSSVGDYKILTVKNHDEASGGDDPTFGSGEIEYDLFDGNADASITNAAQLIVVLNGVIQKPNSGTYSGSEEGFYLNDTHGIKFCTAPPSGSTLYVTQIGSATTISTPGTGSISNANMFASGVINAAAIGTGAVEHAKLANDAVDGDNLVDNAVDSEHYTDGSIDNEHLADNAVDLAEMAHGTQGDILYYGSGGAPTRLGVGTSGQFLKTQGGSANPVWATVSTSTDFASLTDTTVNTSNPSTTSNPSATGHIHLNKSTGQAFVCTDNSNNANVWKNIGAGANSIGASFSADFLVVAGGGGGSARGGGAGAGGMRASYNSETSGGGGSSESALTINPGTTYTITVGPGGAAQSNYNITGANGSNSSISGSDITDIVSVGGGGGGSNASQGNPGDGGCGGGGGYTGFSTTGGTGTANQGYDGGDASGTGPYASGGGGGAGAAGGDGSGSSTQCGHGGAGAASTITGSSVTYAGGGGGSGNPATSMVAGNAGAGGGGAGNNSGNGADGTDGLGGGAGGSYDDDGGKGGDGVVILRMPTASCNRPGILAASSITTSGSDTIIKWLGSGEYQA